MENVVGKILKDYSFLQRSNFDNFSLRNLSSKIDENPGSLSRLMASDKLNISIKKANQIIDQLELSKKIKSEYLNQIQFKNKKNTAHYYQYIERTNIDAFSKLNHNLIFQIFDGLIFNDKTDINKYYESFIKDHCSKINYNHYLIILKRLEYLKLIKIENKQITKLQSKISIGQNQTNLKAKNRVRESLKRVKRSIDFKIKNISNNSFVNINPYNIKELKIKLDQFFDSFYLNFLSSNSKNQFEVNINLFSLKRED